MKYFLIIVGMLVLLVGSLAEAGQEAITTSVSTYAPKEFVGTPQEYPMAVRLATAMAEKDAQEVLEVPKIYILAKKVTPVEEFKSGGEVKVLLTAASRPLVPKQKLELSKKEHQDIVKGENGWRLVHLNGASILKMQFPGSMSIQQAFEVLLVEVVFEKGTPLVIDMATSWGQSYLRIIYPDRGEVPKEIKIASPDGRIDYELVLQNPDK